jgi:hypothetical protein
VNYDLWDVLFSINTYRFCFSILLICMLPMVREWSWQKKATLMFLKIFSLRYAKFFFFWGGHMYNIKFQTCQSFHFGIIIGSRSCKWKHFCPDARCLDKFGPCLFCSRQFCIGCENGKLISFYALCIFHLIFLFG